MERTQLFTAARDYENRTQTYRWSFGEEFRIGLDGQIVDVSTHLTLANSNAAHQWIAEHAHRNDVLGATRATRPPDTKPSSPIESIAQRRNA